MRLIVSLIISCFAAVNFYVGMNKPYSINLLLAICRGIAKILYCCIVLFKILTYNYHFQHTNLYIFIDSSKYHQKEEIENKQLISKV